MLRFYPMLFLLLIIFVLMCSGPVKAHHNPTFGFAGIAGPILTNPASTILKGHWGVGIRTEYVNFNEFSNDALKSFAKKRQFLHNTDYFLTPTVVIAYGLTDDLNCAVRVPYNIQGNITDGALNRFDIPFLIRRGTSDGLGDLSIFAQYRFINLKEKQFESAILTGITIPSGLAHIKDDVGERFGPDHQPGKRSFDPSVGLSLTKRFGHKLSFDSNYLFTKAVNGIQDFYSGDLHNYNVALSYRFLEPHHHNNYNNHTHEHKHTFGPYQEETFTHEHLHKHRWYSIFGADAIIELNGEWRQKQEFGNMHPFGFKDEHSGGGLVYVSPGFRLSVGESWSTYISFGIPAIQDPNGDGQKTDFRMIFGISKSF